MRRPDLKTILTLSVFFALACAISPIYAQAPGGVPRPLNPSERRARGIVKGYLDCWQKENYELMYELYTYKPRGKRIPFKRWKTLAERVELVEYRVIRVYQRAENSVAVYVKLVTRSRRKKEEKREEVKRVIVSKVDERNRASRYGKWKISALTIFPHQ